MTDSESDDDETASSSEELADDKSDGVEAPDET